MKKITSLLSEVVACAFEKCGYDPKLGVVTVSDRMDLCQFQCNGAFAGAKLYKKAPFMIANDVKTALETSEIFGKVEVANPGFLNLTLTDEFLAGYVNEMALDANLGVPQAESEETIVLDYGGPNVAKPLHIGHLRSAIIGEAIKRIARATGRKVIGDVHLGDWGTPIGLCIAEYMERHPEWDCFKPDFDPEKDSVPELDAKELNEIYPYASAKSKEDPDFKEKAHEITSLFQKKHLGYEALRKEIVKISVQDAKRSYDKLDVEFDLWYGESDAYDYIDELVETLTDKGLLYESDGAMVVDVAEESDKITMPPAIIKKADGSNIYATTDLATIIQRRKDFDPDRIWYLTDKRQALHFTQVFRCAKKAGIVGDNVEFKFLGFGTMNGADGKPFKTRDGGVMRLSDLIDIATEGALEKLKDSEYISGDKAEIAQKIGVAAIKFGDLSNHPTKDYVFDLDKFLSFDGKTGTYLLYTVTRINSILKKADIAYNEKRTINGIYTDVERELALTLALTGEVFQRAFEEMTPSTICDNAYNIATAFSRFYHDNHILNEADEEKKKSWLALSLITRYLLTKHLDVLAIEYVENM
ncbi:MAG: arginine--tRNA ligase [Oscillospiraceae bacterium]|nr:arginine--tRNA ligase [Oscillospiraceae bacterium]